MASGRNGSWRPVLRNTIFLLLWFLGCTYCNLLIFNIISCIINFDLVCILMQLNVFFKSISFSWDDFLIISITLCCIVICCWLLLGWWRWCRCWWLFGGNSNWCWWWLVHDNLWNLHLFWCSHMYSWYSPMCSWRRRHLCSNTGNSWRWSSLINKPLNLLLNDLNLLSNYRNLNYLLYYNYFLTFHRNLNDLSLLLWKIGDKFSQIFLHSFHSCQDKVQLVFA